MIISNLLYVLIEVVVLAVTPLMLMLKSPWWFAKRHAIMAGGLVYIVYVSSKMKFNFAMVWALIPYTYRVIGYTVIPTIFFLVLIWIIFKVNPTQVTKMTKTVNHNKLPWYAPLVLYPLLSVPVQEILFRWYAINRMMLLNENIWVPIGVAAIIFAVAHIPFASKIMAMGTLVMGVWWGYLFVSTGSLWPSIISHAIIGSYVMWLGIKPPLEFATNSG